MQFSKELHKLRISDSVILFLGKGISERENYDFGKIDYNV